MPRLLLMTGPAAGTVLDLAEETLLGRHPDCHIPLEGPAVSRRHARIKLSGTGYEIENLQARNVTFLNGDAISQPTPLANGDIIQIGLAEFRFEADRIKPSYCKWAIDVTDSGSVERIVIEADWLGLGPGCGDKDRLEIVQRDGVFEKVRSRRRPSDTLLNAGGPVGAVIEGGGFGLMLSSLADQHEMALSDSQDPSSNSDRAEVDELLTALNQPAIECPEPATMGVTPEWLTTHCRPLVDEHFGSFSQEGRERLAARCSNWQLVNNCIVGNFQGSWTDDYPSMGVSVFLRDGGVVQVRSRSQYAFMIPWVIEWQNLRFATYNTRISAAVSQLLPSDFLNRKRLSADVVRYAVGAIASHFGDLLDQPVWSQQGHAKRICGLYFTPNEQYLVSAAWDNAVCIWSAQDGSLRQILDMPRVGVNLAVAVSPDGRFIAFNDSTVVQLANLESGAARRRLGDHKWVVKKLVFSPDGAFLASQDSDELKVWRVADGETILRSPKESLVGFTASGDYLVTRDGTNGVVRGVGVWDIVHRIGNCDRIKLAAGTDAAAYWEGDSSIRVLDLASLQALGRADVADPKASWGISPDGQTIAWVDGKEEIVLCNVVAEQEQVRLHSSGRVEHLMFSLDGQLLLTIQSTSFCQRLAAWDTLGGSCWVVKNTANVECATLSRSNKALASGHSDGTVCIWNRS